MKEDKLSDTSSLEVLIVDDSIEINNITARLLRAEGVSVHQAFDGKECFEFLSENSCDLLLLDIVLPDMDGIDICRQIKYSDEFPEMFIVLISGKRHDSEFQVEGLESGADSFIVRPISNKELSARIKAFSRIISSEKKLQALLAHSRKLEGELAESNAMKDRFFSIIAHDLKSPFNSVLGLIDIIDADFDSIEKAELKKIFDMLKISSKNIYNLLENLLLWAQTQSHRLEFAPEWLNLKQTVHESCTLTQQMAANKQISISENITDNLEVFADGNMLNTIVRNLLTNAIKFSNTNGVIHIYSVVLPDYIEIIVIDQGTGIAQENIEKLFKIDSIYSTPGTSNEKGTGLGLVITNEFVQKHNGSITVVSKENSGTKISFTLPIYRIGE
jgi:two-component system, sensor histidine kinase and response regulator